MREYETVYVLKPDLPADAVKGLQEKLAAIVQKQNGHVLVHTDWGRRKLAYPVEKFKFAQYIYFQYLDLGTSIAEVERILKNDDKVLKFLTVRLNDDVNSEERLAAAVAPPPPPEEFGYSEGDEGPPRDRGGGDYQRGGGDYRRPERPPFEGDREPARGADSPDRGE